MSTCNYSYQKQTGAVLIVGLIMMLLLTILGLASMGDSELQERMSGNVRDRNIAFQAAEGALRIAEDDLQTFTGLSAATFDGSRRGYYPDFKTDGTSVVNNYTDPGPDLEDDTDDVGLSETITDGPAGWTGEEWARRGIQVDSDSFDGLAEQQQPYYVVEYLTFSPTPSNSGNAIGLGSRASVADIEYYRITSYSVGGTADAEVILQTTFAR